MARKAYFCIKSEDTNYLYSLNYPVSGYINDILYDLYDKYRNVEEDTLNNIKLIGGLRGRPADFDKYSWYSKDELEVIEYKIVSSKSSYASALSKLEKEYKETESSAVLLELLELRDNLRYVTDDIKATVNVKVAYNPIIRRVLNHILFSKYNIINMTDIIKICNFVIGIENSFEYDPTFYRLGMLERPSFKNFEPGFTDIDSYNEFKEKSKTVLNNHIKLLKTEENIGKDEITEILTNIFKSMNIQYIGCFTLDANSSDDLRLLDRFGKRNSKMFDNPIFTNIIDIMQKLRNESENYIVTNYFYLENSDIYDFDGRKFDKKKLEEIRMFNERKKSTELFTKKTKK